MIPDPELHHLLSLGQSIRRFDPLVRKPTWVDIMNHVSSKSNNPHFASMDLARDCASALALAANHGNPEAVKQLESGLYAEPELRDAYINLVKLSRPELVGEFMSAIRKIMPDDLVVDWEDIGETSARAGDKRRSNPDAHDQDDIHRYLHKPIESYPKHPKSMKRTVSAAQISDLRDFVYESNHPVDLIMTPTMINNSLFLGGMMAECTWATGLRPGEWRDAYLLVGDRKRQSTADGKIREKLEQMPAVSPDNPKGFRNHMNAAIEEVLSKGEIWLRVKSLKTKNRIAPIPDHRFLGVGNLPLSTRVTLFALLVGARSVGKDAWERLVRNAQRRIAAASKKILPEFNGRFSFLQLRNDFGDRGRAVLDPWVLAYVMGHSSLKSQSEYGRRGRSPKSGSRRPDMLIKAPGRKSGRTG